MALPLSVFFFLFRLNSCINRFIGKFNNSLFRLTFSPNLSYAEKLVHFSDLSRNRLAKVTNGAFVNLSNLTYLDLSYNKLVKLESASVEPLKKLHTLNISGNIQMDLYDIREAFQVNFILASLILLVFDSLMSVSNSIRFAAKIGQVVISSVFFSFFLSFNQLQLLHNLKTLSIADMGVIPYELLVPLGQLKSLNLSGNHLVNVSMQILHPVNSLEVCMALKKKCY